MFLEYSADICTRENLTFDEHLENVFRECSVNVRTIFSECSYEHSVNIWCCLQANVQRTFARTFGEHNANVHTIFGVKYLPVI